MLLINGFSCLEINRSKKVVLYLKYRMTFLLCICYNQSVYLKVKEIKLMDKIDYIKEFVLEVSSEIKSSDFEGIDKLFSDKEVDLGYDR